MLSARLSGSIAGILSKRLNISPDFFPPSGSYTVLVFPHQNVTAVFRRDFKMYEKNADFPSAILNFLQDMTIVTTECELETAAKLSSGTHFNDLE